MKKKLRNHRILLSTILCMGLFTGCGSDDTDVTKSKEKNNQSIPLKVQLIGNFEQEDSTDPISGEKRLGVHILEEEFEKQNPGVDLEFIIMGWDDYQKKTQSMMISGAADVYQAPGIAALVEQDLLEPLQSYIDKDNFDLGIYIDGQVEGWKVCGINDQKPQIYGLPCIADTRFIAYDKQIFDDWGVEYLSEYPTLEEILEKAKKMTGTNPVSGEENFGIIYTGKDAADTVMNINEYLGGTWGEGNTESDMKVYFNSSTMIQAFEYLKQINTYAPSGVMANQGGELFGTKDNNIAINLRSAPVVINTANVQNLGERYGVARLFINEEKGMGGMFAGSPNVIAKSSKNKELAWEYIKFTSSDFYAKYFWENQKTEGLPTIKSIVDFDGIKGDKNQEAIIDSLKFLWTPRYIYRAGQGRGILTTAVEDAILNKKDIKETLDTAQKEMDDWIKQQ